MSARNIPSSLSQTEKSLWTTLKSKALFSLTSSNSRLCYSFSGMKQTCPCCSGKSYADCCKPFHDGQLPATPLELMRSRYSAYALNKPRYIMETTHSKSPYFESDRKKWEQAIIQFCTNTNFVHLSIIDFGEDTVHFAATLRQDEREFILEEKSQFLRVDGKWLYLSGVVSRQSS